MKRFVIKPPAAGRSKATLVTHDYSTAEQRTQTVYLGGFSLDLDPDQIPVDGVVEPGSMAFGVSLKAGAVAWGEPFSLASTDLSRIRRWLEMYGTYRKRVEAEASARAHAEALSRAAHAELVADVEADLRGRLEAQWRAEFQAALERSQQRPLDAAEEALGQACNDLRRRAAELVAAGHRLTKLRSASTETSAASSPLDELQARANRIRLEAFAAFERACKEAGLMVGAKRGSRKRTRVANHPDSLAHVAT